MNREEKRQMMKQGASKQTVDMLAEFDKPATLREVVSIARASAEDVVADYQQRSSSLQIAVSLQVEIMKDAIIKAGLITEDEFRERYMEQATLFNKRQDEYNTMSHEANPKMDVKVDDIDVKVERK